MENISIVDVGQTESGTVIVDLPTVCETQYDVKEEPHCDELGSENVYNSSPGVTDVVQPHDPELESKENISLTGFEIEMNEEQIVFKRKRRAREIEITHKDVAEIVQETVVEKSPSTIMARDAAMRAASRSRSRSVTPSPGDRPQPLRSSAARRALHMNLLHEVPVSDPPLSPSPPRRYAFPVQATPGGSLNVQGDPLPVEQTPGGRVPIGQNEPALPLWSSVVERVERLDMSEEETEDLMDNHPWHVQRWMEDLPGVTNVARSTPLMPSSTSEVAATTEVDAVPSTSGVTAPSKRVPRCDGSDLDSEFDDEFDIELMPSARDFPDTEELDDREQRTLAEIETGMDDAADRLLGTSASFEWVSDFDSFRAVREEFSGPTPGPVKDYDSPYDAFVDIWDKDIIQLIVRETNRYAQQTVETMRSRGTLKPSSRLHLWTDTNEEEIMVFFGMFMYMAIDPRTSLSEYWSSNAVLQMPGFRRLMSYNRYVLLNKFLHFVDNDESQVSQTEATSSTRQAAKLRKLAPVIEHLGKKFNSLYHLGPEISIDESLTLFKGSLSWVQTIRSKSARFGIKSYELCEARTGYMARFQIYTGKDDSSDGEPSSLGINLGGKSTKVVLDLLQGLERRGHCVVMDNYYNCPSLARYLKSLGFDCLGTLRPNRRNVPSDIAKMSKKVRKGTIVSRHCGDVSIVAWKDSKVVNIISTYHNSDTYIGTRAGKRVVKPVCVRDYNRTMGGVDLKDQKLSMYLLERKRGVKWYIKMFKRLLNVSIHNALVMYVGSLERRGQLPITHREFRYELADSLTNRHRPPIVEISKPVADLMRLRQNIVHAPEYSIGGHKRSRCVLCYRKKVNKKVQSRCVTCDVYLCFAECWTVWHSEAELPGEDIRGRKRKRRE